MTTPSALSSKRCKPCEERVHATALTQDEMNALLQQLDGWTLQQNAISRNFEFKDFSQTMAFVNAVAWISQRENHHPDLNVGHRKCRLEYTTHAVKGLTESDFICAAKVDALFRL